MDNKYLNGYRRFTFDWPYEDQEKYSEYEAALEELESKEIVSAEEYNETLSRLEAEGNYDEMENYRRGYVSEVDYHFTREQLLEDMKFLQSMYRVTEEQLAEDKRMRAMFSKDRLKMLKRTYEARGNSNIMRDLDVDTLSDDEAIEMYRNIRRGLSFEDDKRISNESIWDRVRKYGEEPTPPPVTDDVPSDNPDDGDNETTDDKDDEKEEVEKHIRKYNSDVERVREHLEEINGRLVLGDVSDIDSEIIRRVDSEVRILADNATELIGRIDEFKSKYTEEDLSKNYDDIMSELQEIKNDLRALKQLHIESYNNAVDATRLAIEELRNLNNPEINERLASLPELNKCEINIRSWNASLKYLDEIRYDLLIEVNRQLSEIQSQTMNAPTEIDPVPEEDERKEAYPMEIWDLISRMESIEQRITALKEGFTDEMSLQEINDLRTEINRISGSLMVFYARLDDCRREIPEAEVILDELNDRYDAAIDELYALNNLLNNKKVDNDKKFNELKGRANSFMISLDSMERLVESVKGQTNSVTVKKWLEILQHYGTDIEQLENDVKTSFENKEIDENQNNQLTGMVGELKTKLGQLNEKLRDPEMYKDVDIFTILNSDISNLEAEIDALDAEIEGLEKPIKRPTRKVLDAKFKELEKEIKTLESLLEKYKDKDPEKYNQTKERLDAAKDKLDKVGKKYRSKCPLAVRVVKSAVNFYKKHKKLCLIIAGLAAFALVAHHVIIPAIMHGNIMIASRSLGMRGFANFSNKVLGSFIGAKSTTDGYWFLANGVRLNPFSATSSLLKGLAISGLGHAALYSPIIAGLVVAIKKLTEKMKKVELKEKLKQEKEKLIEATKKKKENKGNNKKAEKLTMEEWKKLLKEYRTSGKSIEEFAEEKELSEREKITLEVLYEQYLKSVEETKISHDNTSRGGRR